MYATIGKYCIQLYLLMDTVWSNSNDTKFMLHVMYQLFSRSDRVRSVLFLQASRVYSDQFYSSGKSRNHAPFWPQSAGFYGFEQLWPGCMWLTIRLCRWLLFYAILCNSPHFTRFSKFKQNSIVYVHCSTPLTPRYLDTNTMSTNLLTYTCGWMPVLERVTVIGYVHWDVWLWWNYRVQVTSESLPRDLDASPLDLPSPLGGSSAAGQTTDASNVMRDFTGVGDLAP